MEKKLWSYKTRGRLDFERLYLNSSEAFKYDVIN